MIKNKPYSGKMFNRLSGIFLSFRISFYLFLTSREHLDYLLQMSYFQLGILEKRLVPHVPLYYYDWPSRFWPSKKDLYFSILKIKQQIMELECLTERK